jgi:hypothetical protein
MMQLAYGLAMCDELDHLLGKFAYESKKLAQSQVFVFTKDSVQSILTDKKNDCVLAEANRAYEIVSGTICFSGGRSSYREKCKDSLRTVPGISYCHKARIGTDTVELFIPIKNKPDSVIPVLYLRKP